MTKLEEVARAMIEFEVSQPLIACACLGKEFPSDPLCKCKMRGYRELARAAVKALMDPSEAMKDCMVGAGWHGNIEGCCKEEISCGTILWESQIEAILNEPTKESK